ncbi:nucleoporin Nup145p [Monosporozyma servazzii]
MFTSKPNTSSLFGNSTSTPTSTPGPSQSGANNPLFSQKPNGIFNNVNTSNSIGTSTPSPSTGLFGNKPANTSGPTTTGGLFGNTTTNTAAVSGGLFGNSATTSAAPSGGLFGNSASNNQTSTGLFGAKPAAPATGGLFGNSSNTNTSSFGNSATNGYTSNITTSGGLFGNKPATSGGLFGNNATTQPPVPQSQSNPYGLNIGNPTTGGSAMPAPIIETLKKGTNIEINTGTTHKPSASKRSFSISSNVPAPVSNVPYSNLFHKLNSRLNSVKNIASTKGIFSPSCNSHEYLKSNNLSNQRSTSVKDIAAFASGTGDVQELRRLKIDTARSAAKKMKLLTGAPVVTKLNNEEKEEAKTNELLDTDDTKDETKQIKEQSKIPDLDDKEESQKEASDLNSSSVSSKQQNTDYWCSPSIESLSKLTQTQLKAVPNFIIGRKGFGNISFNYDVDLSALAPNLKEELFGKTVSFYSTRTVEVYPDHSSKPVVGSGLNVPATISLEKVYPVDKKTKKPIIDASRTDEMQVLIRKLKNMRDMEFISYNPFGGIWTFKVNHFSIWGLVNDDDVEIDQEEINSYKQHADNPIYGTNMHLDNRQLISTNPEISSSEDFIMNDSDPILNDGIVEEKQYEPDVMEQDFDALQAQPNLNISNDWISQLKLAGSNEHTIFVDEANLQSIPARITDVFRDFDNDREADKLITKSLKLTSNTNFSTVLYNNNILVKDLVSQSSVSIYSPNSVLGNKFNIPRELFQRHISASVIEKRANLNLPCVINFDFKFQDILQVLPSTDSLHDIWKLCALLFDEIELPYENENDSVKTALLKQARYNNLCSWLENNMERNLNTKKFDTSDPLDSIFVALMKNDVINAAKIAIASNNRHLAVLISYLGSNDPRVRELSDLQLSKWRSNGQTVDFKIERIYQLLSGELFGDENQITDLVDQYGWLSVFSLAIYYGQIDEMSLEEMVESQLFIIEKSDDILVSAIFNIFSQEGNVDSLLKKMSINSVKNKSNVQFLWYLAQILVFKNHRSISESLKDKVTLQYIDQLKLLGCSLESLYVALFINNDQAANQTIKTILNHIIPAVWDNEGNRDIILEKLHLPKESVYGSLALKEKYVGNYVKEMEHLIVGELFEEAAKLICKEVGPKLVLSYNQGENVQYLNILNEFVKRLPQSKCSSFTKEISLFSQFVKLVSAGEGKNISKQDILSIEENLNSYYENNKHYKIIPACCNIINKRIQYLKTE